MRRFLRITSTLCGLVVALLAIVPLPALSATYTFSGSSLPPCTTWNGAWTVSGTTYTCDATASLAAGDIIAPAAGITVVAKAGWTLGGNNVVGSAGARVLMQSTYGDIVINGGTTIHGSLVSGSGDITVSGSSSITINGNLTTSSGNISTANTVVNGSLSGGGKVFLNGGRVTGNVSGTTGVTATGGTIIGGNVLATNGTISLSGGSVTGSVISNCCTISTVSTNVSGGLRSDRNTVSINGGTINGGIYSSGGSGIIIKNATVAGGDITATSVPISISNSDIGSPVSLIDITSKNTISISDSTVNGSVTAGGWAGSLTITGESDVTISCYPEPVPVVPGACGGTGGGTTIHHYEIDIPAAGLTCENTTLPVRACTSSTAPCTASLATTSTTTTLAASAGTFVNSGGATISFTGTGGYILAAPNPAVVNLSLAAPSGASLQCFRFEGTSRTPASCQFDVKNSLFRFTVPNFAAGDGPPAVTMEAVRQDDTTRKCVSFAPAGGVKMWTEYVNPASGTKTLSLTYGSQVVALPAAVPASGNVPLVFNNLGETSIGVNYLDAGMVRLRAKWNMTEGESTFVVKPWFAVSDLVCADNTANPGASDATGAKFCRAGESFRATVKAVAKDQVTTTPNFGRETPPESVILAAAQTSPVPAAAGVFQGGTSLVKDNTDPSIARSTALAWSEVGVISLTPQVADGDYLGAANAAGAGVTVGRFYPHHFATEVIAPMPCPAGVAPGCPSSRGAPVKGMSYAGQAFGVKVSALNAGGTITRNYRTGSGAANAYAKPAVLAAVSALGGAAAPAGQGAGTLAGGMIGAGNFVDGVATIANVTYRFSTPPGTPTNVFLRASETGGDGVGSLLSPAGSSEEGGFLVAQGRIRMSNVFGTGRVALKMPVEAQYWSGDSWVRNVSDNTSLPVSAVTSKPALTAIGALSFSAGTGNLVLGPAAAGSYTLGINLGATGAAFVSCDAGMSGGTGANVPWLRSRNGSCANSAAYAVDPSAVATFGIFPPETRRTIHVREAY